MPSLPQPSNTHSRGPAALAHAPSASLDHWLLSPVAGSLYVPVPVLTGPVVGARVAVLENLTVWKIPGFYYIGTTGLFGRPSGEGTLSPLELWTFLSFLVSGFPRGQRFTHLHPDAPYFQLTSCGQWMWVRVRTRSGSFFQTQAISSVSHRGEFLYVSLAFYTRKKRRFDGGVLLRFRGRHVLKFLKNQTYCVCELLSLGIGGAAIHPDPDAPVFSAYFLWRQ